MKKYITLWLFILAFLPSIGLSLLGFGGPDDIIAGIVLILWLIPGGLLFSFGFLRLIINPQQNLKDAIFTKKDGAIGILTRISTLFFLILPHSFISEILIYSINNPSMIQYFLHSQIIPKIYMSFIIFSSAIYLFGKWNHNKYILWGILVSQLIICNLIFN